MRYRLWELPVAENNSPNDRRVGNRAPAEELTPAAKNCIQV